METHGGAPARGAGARSAPPAPPLSLSVALCCLNERRNLPEVLERLKALEGELDGRLREVIVVDGGSADGSWEFLQQAAASWPVLKLCRQQPPAGYGSGYRQSVLACSSELIMTCDTDLNYDLRDAVRMLPLLAEADLVVANPLLRESTARLGPWRMMLTRGVSLLYRVALAGRPTVTVFTPILRVGRAEVFKAAAPQTNNFTASAEFMMRVYLTTRARVREAPIPVWLRGGGSSKMRMGPTILSHLRLFGRVVVFRLGLRKVLVE